MSKQSSQFPIANSLTTKLLATNPFEHFAKMQQSEPIAWLEPTQHPSQIHLIMEDLLNATLKYLTYCANKEPRVKQHYPVVQANDFHKQEQQPQMMPMVEEVLNLIDFETLEDSPENSLLKELGKAYKSLYWRETSPIYAGTSFANNYSACIFAAPKLEFWKGAHYHVDDLSIGFTVHRPNTLYPDHHHKALEFYTTLYGKASWRRGDGVYVEKGIGALVYHQENENHAIRTDDSYLINFYAWVGDLESPPVVPRIPDE